MNTEYIQAIEQLLLHGGQARVRLPNNLNLAFTPAENRQGMNRLNLSRLGVYPNDDETRDLLEAWHLVLRERTRKWGHVVTQGPQLATFCRQGDYGCTLLTWRTATSSQLLMLRDSEARRSAEWLQQVRALAGSDATQRTSRAGRREMAL